MKISLFDSPQVVADGVANATRAQEAGLHRYWSPQVMNADTMMTLAAVAAAVPDIQLGTSVMAMQTMLPQTMAQQSRTLNQISGGRFTLGIGVNHKPVVTSRWGLPWDKPYSRFVEYLDALQPLLADGAVDVSGEYVSHTTAIEVPSEEPGLMLAALGPKMLNLAGARSGGTITWMTGPKTIASHIRPGLEAGGGGEIVAGVSMVVTNSDEETAQARAWANKALAIYPQLPSYRAVMDREGAVEAADLVLIGSADEVRAGIETYRDAGTNEVALNLMGSPEQNDQSWGLIQTLASAE